MNPRRRRRDVDLLCVELVVLPGHDVRFDELPQSIAAANEHHQPQGHGQSPRRRSTVGFVCGRLRVGRGRASHQRTTPARSASRTIQLHKAGRSRPPAAAARGARLVDVSPGTVLTSKTQGKPAESSSRSTRTRPEVSRLAAAATAVCCNCGNLLGAEPGFEAQLGVAAGVIFGLVAEHRVAGGNLQQRQRATIEHGNGEFASGQIHLGQNERVESARLGDQCGQIVRPLGEANAQARTLAVGFDHQRVAETDQLRGNVVDRIGGVKHRRRGASECRPGRIAPWLPTCSSPTATRRAGCRYRSRPVVRAGVGFARLRPGRRARR